MTTLDPKIASAIRARAQVIREWMAEEAPYAAADQRHLDLNTPERAYWHFGYQAALQDILDYALVCSSPKPVKMEPEMPRVTVPLQSSVLSSAGYDPDTRALDITFVGGGTYTYEDVPEKVFEELRDAPSPGAYFHAGIRGQY